MDYTVKKKNDSLFDFYLTEDETILWMGQPNPTRLLSMSDVFLIPFSLMWGGFAIVWTLMATGGGISLFSLWGIPFVLVGQYVIWGRFVHKYIKRKNTYYALTDQRALVLTRLFGSNLKAYRLDMFPMVNRRGNSILFDNDSIMNRGWQTWSGETVAGFYSISDADEVYHLMQSKMMPSKAKRIA